MDMTEIFRTVLNMSITGAYIAAAIIILRIAMKKLPKKYSYLLWAILGIRLLCPFSFSSAASIFNVLVPEKPAINSGQMEFIPNDIEYAAEPRITVSVPPVNNVISEQLPSAQPTASANPMQTAMAVGTFVWAFGVLAMAVYTVVSYISVRKKVRNAKLSDGNVYTCESIETPFVFGLIKPHIYLPENLADGDRPYIIAHEQTHIDRKDYIVKLIAMVALCVHWFNPMVWLSYRLMTKDMELSCDEKALGSFDLDVKKAYANALLNISLKQNRLSLGGVLSFGESNIKSRIKGVLGAKKPKVTAVISAVIAVIAAAVCLLTNAVKKDNTFEPIPNGIYVTDKLLYTAPYKDSYFGDNNGLTYEIRDRTLTISGEDTQTYKLSEPMEIPFTDKEWDSTYNSMESIGWEDGAKHLSDCKNKYCAEIFTDTDGFDSYIFVMDDELWYVQYGWEIYRLKAAGGNASEKFTQPTDAARAYLNGKNVPDDDIFTLTVQQDSFFHEAWKYTLPPLSEQYNVNEKDSIVEVFAEYRLDGNFVQSYIITAANKDGFRIVDEVNYSPRQFTATISEVSGNEQITGYEWQEYVIIPNEDSGIFKANEPAVVYSRSLIGNNLANVGDSVTVEYGGEPVSDIGLEQPAYFLTMTLNDEEPEVVSDDDTVDEPAFVHTHLQQISLKRQIVFPDEYGAYNFIGSAEIVDIRFSVPKDWVADGYGLFMLGDKKMLEQNVVYPDSCGLMTEGFLTDMVSGREIQKLDEKYGGENDPYSYYIHTSMEDHDSVYDTHYFVVHQNGYYAVFSFRSGENFSFSEAEDILRTVSIAPVQTVIDINAMQDITVEMPIGTLNADGTVTSDDENGTAVISFRMPSEWTPIDSSGYYYGKPIFRIDSVYNTVEDQNYSFLTDDDVIDETTAADGFDYMVHKISYGTEIYEYIVTRNGLSADIRFYADESLTEEVRSAIIKSINIERLTAN